MNRENGVRIITYHLTKVSAFMQWLILRIKFGRHLKCFKKEQNVLHLLSSVCFWFFYNDHFPFDIYWFLYLDVLPSLNGNALVKQLSLLLLLSLSCYQRNDIWTTPMPLPDWESASLFPCYEYAQEIYNLYWDQDPNWIDYISPTPESRPSMPL